MIKEQEMNRENEMDRLEETVQKLLEKYSALRAVKEDLEQNLRQKEETIEKLNGEISQMQSERGSLSNRVDNILQQIQDWEESNALDDDREKPEDEEQEELEESGQGSSFAASS
ncbi:MAG: hypothetical protein CSB24_05115 [Deltaproteobacteria bacterium]|nr:MAG: hypothetical protein CSB24_05115 [Deltaproteobacteria bacterium]